MSWLPTQLIFLLQCFEILDQSIDLSMSSLFNPSERLVGFDWLAVAIAPDRHLSRSVNRDNSCRRCQASRVG
jgi:hypothetical protein